jgi:hypothetical protein
MCNTFLVTLLLSQGASGQAELSKEQLAAILLLLQPAMDEELAVSEFAFNYDPSSRALGSGALNNGLSFAIQGTKTNDGDVTTVEGYNISSSADPRLQITANLNENGLLSDITSPVGTVEFVYSGSLVIARMTDASGITTEFQFDNPLPQDAVASLESRSGFSALQNSIITTPEEACSMEDAFGLRKKSGQLVFACDNEFTDFAIDSDGDGLFVPQFLSGTFRSARADAALLGEPSINLNPAAQLSDPAVSRHVYDYSASIPTRSPSLEEWLSCCDKLAANPALLLANDYAVVIASTFLAVLDASDSFLEETSEQVCNDLLSPSVDRQPPGILGACVIHFANQAIDAVKDEIVSGVCEEFVFTDQLEKSGLGLDAWRHVTARFDKVGVANGGARFTEQGLNFLDDAQLDAEQLPTLVLGPTPPRTLGLGGTTAFRVIDNNGVLIDGDLIEERDGKLVVFDGNLGTYVDAKFGLGERLKFRMFDEFYDRSKPNSLSTRIETQHYECGVYDWTLYRNGQIVESGVQLSNTDGWTTDSLEPGSYRMCGGMQNGSLSGYTLGDTSVPYTAASEYVAEDRTTWVGVPPPIVDQECVAFTVEKPKLGNCRTTRLASEGNSIVGSVQCGAALFCDEWILDCESTAEGGAYREFVGGLSQADAKWNGGVGDTRNPSSYEGTNFTIERTGTFNSGVTIDGFQTDNKVVQALIPVDLSDPTLGSSFKETFSIRVGEGSNNSRRRFTYEDTKNFTYEITSCVKNPDGSVAFTTIENAVIVDGARTSYNNESFEGDAGCPTRDEMNAVHASHAREDLITLRCIDRGVVGDQCPDIRCINDGYELDSCPYITP